MESQAVNTLVATTTRIDTFIGTATYGGAFATFVTGWLSWLSANQSGFTVLAMLLTCGVTVVSALYGIYHKHCLRKIAATQGFQALRKSDRYHSED